MASRTARTRLLLPGLLTAALLLVTAALVGPISPANAAVTQGITGTLTGAGGSTLEGNVRVIPVDPTKSTLDIGVGADGKFAETLPTGQYWLYFTGLDPDFVSSPTEWAPEWWSNATTKGDSTIVTITANTVVTTDVAFTAGGSISGYVDQDGKQVGQHDTMVSIYQVDTGFPDGLRYVGWTLISSSGDGTYVARGLATGSYKLYFELRYSGRDGWWENAPNRQQATPVVVTAPNATTGINPVGLAKFGRISGKVTRASNGAALEDVAIRPHRLTESGTWSPDTDYSASTEADGTYSFGLPEGTYRIEFRPSSTSGLNGEFWNDALTVDGGESIVVVPGSSKTAVDGALSAAPTVLTNVVRPTISGVAKIGSTLEAEEGTWQPDVQMVFGFQWFRNGVAIKGAEGSEYKVAPVDAGRTLTVRATAHRSGYADKTASSLPTARVPYLGTIKLTSGASITGKLKVGKTLKAVAPRSAPAATASYQWFRNGKAISGAIKSTRKLTSRDKGKRLSVRITLSRAGYPGVVKTVARTGKVK